MHCEYGSHPASGVSYPGPRLVTDNVLSGAVLNLLVGVTVSSPRVGRPPPVSSRRTRLPLVDTSKTRSVERLSGFDRSTQGRPFRKRPIQALLRMPMTTREKDSNRSSTAYPPDGDLAGVHGLDKSALSLF